MEEVWKDIEGYDGMYQVSNTGKVKSFSNGCKGALLGMTLNNGGYAIAHLYKGNKRKHGLVHRLVANAFIPNPENKGDVNHLNGIRTDNGVENLEWCSRSENHIHAFKYLGKKTYSEGKFGGDSLSAKRINQFSRDGVLLRVWPSMSDIYRELGFGLGLISQNCHGKIKTAKGFKFQFA